MPRPTTAGTTAQQGSNPTLTAPGNNPAGGGFDHGTTDPLGTNQSTLSFDPNIGTDGIFADTATFDVNVASGHTYNLTFYLGDALQATEMTISLNNNGTVTALIRRTTAASSPPARRASPAVRSATAKAAGIRSLTGPLSRPVRSYRSPSRGCRMRTATSPASLPSTGWT